MLWVQRADSRPGAGTAGAASWAYRPLIAIRAGSASPLEGAGVNVKKADPFYKTARWERLRAAVLRRDGYMCQVSKRYGRHMQADTVHHIYPREEYPEYQWEPWNLISVTWAVHETLHDRATGTLSEKGVELLRRTARRREMEIPLRYQ